MNVRKMQIASLFVSIQQVETEKCKPGETTEEYNRRKAIANLTSVRYRHQMEKLTKQFKKETALTHNYSMPKPSNEVVLTNPLSKDIPEEITTPNMENNIDDELAKLGISPTLLTTTDSQTNQKGLKRMSTLPSSVCHRTSSSLRRTLEQEITTKEASRTKSKQQDYDEQLPSTYLPPHTSDESNAEDQPQSSNSMQHTKRTTSQAPDVQSLKLSQKEHNQAYPWAQEASKNTFCKTELSNEVEYVNISQHSIGKYFTSRMKDQLKEKINLPDVITEKINNCIGMTEKNNKTMYFCKVCNMKSPYNHPKRGMCARHVRIHLGYSLYRCSFCSFISNNPNSVYSHYTTRHGIPKEWIFSENK